MGIDNEHMSKQRSYRCWNCLIKNLKQLLIKKLQVEANTLEMTGKIETLSKEIQDIKKTQREVLGWGN